MPISTIPYTGMNQGFVGSYSRNGDCIIMARQVVPADADPILFGDAVFLINTINATTGGAYSSTQSLITGGVITPVMGGAGTNGSFAGVAVREVKTNLTYPTTNPPLGNYAQGTWADVLERGSIIVQCNYGTPAPGGIVYLRTALNGAIPAGVIGGFEATADGGNSFQITNAEWTTGIKDSNNNCEITMRIRNSA
jgi:hypothetical protein